MARKLEGQAVLKLRIKKAKMLFWLITQEPFGLLKFNASYEFFGQFACNTYIIFHKKFDKFELAHKTC